MEETWDRLGKVLEELQDDSLPDEEKEFLLQRVNHLLGELQRFYIGGIA